MANDLDQDFARLMRRYGQRMTAQSAQAPAPAALLSPHLDADELSAFAEGVLPAAARLRYTAHLADCAACRGLVSELAGGIDHATSGIAQTATENPAANTTKAHAGNADAIASTGGWRAWLGGLFAVPALRYALPALLAIGLTVGGIALYYNAQKSETALVAQNQSYNENTAPSIDESAKRPSATPATGTEGSSAAAPNEPLAAPQSGQTMTAEKPALKDENNKSDPVAKEAEAKAGKAKIAVREETLSAEVAKNNAPPSPAAATPSGGRADGIARERDADDRAPDKRAIATGTVTAPPPPRANREPVATAAERQETTTDVARAEQARNRDQSRDDAPASTAARRAPAAQATPSSGAGATIRGSADASVSEARSVAGHKFYRSDNTWVDENYRGQTLRVVRRGTDGFRRLADDEPVVKTIANSLPGDIIIMLRTRAYRIQ